MADDYFVYVCLGKLLGLYFMFLARAKEIIEEGHVEFQDFDKLDDAAVGDIELNFEVLSPPDQSGHRVLMYAADPGTPAAEALQLLMSCEHATGAEQHKRVTAQ